MIFVTFLFELVVSFAFATGAHIACGRDTQGLNLAQQTLRRSVPTASSDHPAGLAGPSATEGGVIAPGKKGRISGIRAMLVQIGPSYFPLPSLLLADIRSHESRMDEIGLGLDNNGGLETVAGSIVASRIGVF
ncbi:hypothetical protein EYF80_014143 [Liparis tanakae]|uniref:Uncharacterized protein n=1 Tax=Liparis tanakae TaxID=230148 RepID=A0A4Z2IEU8_9TELE|nr:hypothetical protein EYF80_014143 [Liparis tanakae]